MVGTARLVDRTHIILSSAVGGFVTLPILMVAYELAVEQTAHLGIGEGMSCGLINSLANLLGFVYVLILTPFLDRKTKQDCLSSMLFLLTSLAVAMVLIIISNFVNSRKKTQRSGKIK